MLFKYLQITILIIISTISSTCNALAQNGQQPLTEYDLKEVVPGDAPESFAVFQGSSRILYAAKPTPDYDFLAEEIVHFGIHPGGAYRLFGSKNDTLYISAPIDEWRTGYIVDHANLKFVEDGTHSLKEGDEILRVPLSHLKTGVITNDTSSGTGFSGKYHLKAGTPVWTALLTNNPRPGKKPLLGVLSDIRLIPAWCGIAFTGRKIDRETPGCFHYSGPDSYSFIPITALGGDQVKYGRNFIGRFAENKSTGNGSFRGSKWPIPIVKEATSETGPYGNPFDLVIKFANIRSTVRRKSIFFEMKLVDKTGEFPVYGIQYAIDAKTNTASGTIAGHKLDFLVNLKTDQVNVVVTSTDTNISDVAKEVERENSEYLDAIDVKNLDNQ